MSCQSITCVAETFNFPRTADTKQKFQNTLPVIKKWPLETGMPSGCQRQNKRAITSRFGQRGRRKHASTWLSSFSLNRQQKNEKNSEWRIWLHRGSARKKNSSHGSTVCLKGRFRMQSVFYYVIRGQRLVAACLLKLIIDSQTGTCDVNIPLMRHHYNQEMLCFLSSPIRALKSKKKKKRLKSLGSNM